MKVCINSAARWASSSWRKHCQQAKDRHHHACFLSLLLAAEFNNPAYRPQPSLEPAIGTTWQACHPKIVKKLRQEDTYPSAGVLGRPWMANRGATCKCGVVAEPTRATLCSSSPNMQPADHMSIALV